MSDYRTAMEKLEANGHSEMAVKLKEYYRNAVGCFDRECDGEIPLGTSKMGGFPDLPSEIEYPVMSGYSMKWLKGENLGQIERYEESAMQLVAQINLDEVAKSESDIEKLLPTSGMLYIFWSGEISSLVSGDFCEYDVDNPDKSDCYKVIYWNGDVSQLKRTFPPCGYYSKYYTECFEERAIEFDSMDEYEEDAAYDIEELEETLDIEVYDLSEGCCKLLGVPQGSNKPFLAKDQINLFQLDNDDGCLDYVYWIIDKSDLLARDFSKVTIDWDLD